MVILLIGGMALLIAGVLLFPVSAGALPYYENGLYGLLLVIFALQTISLGKTPLGDVRRSRLSLGVGVVIAAAGIVTCVIPTFSLLPRILLFLCFGLGGLLLLLQMLLSPDKFRTGRARGHLPAPDPRVLHGLCPLHARRAAASEPDPAPNTGDGARGPRLWAGGRLPCPCAAVDLSWYPQAATPPPGDVELSIDQAMMLLMGVFMLLLGGLLIPVSLGLLSFSASAQLGLLMVIFAIQMMASGGTPIGPFPRSWLVVVFGFLFVALGIVSCIIPLILVAELTVLVGILNIGGGVIGLVKFGVQARERAGGAAPFPPSLSGSLRLSWS